MAPIRGYPLTWHHSPTACRRGGSPGRTVAAQEKGGMIRWPHQRPHQTIRPKVSDRPFSRSHSGGNDGNRTRVFSLEGRW